MTKKYWFLIFIAPIVVFLDYITKQWAISTLKGKEAITIIENFFHFVYVENRGAAWGMFGKWDDSIRIPFFIAITVVASIILGIIYKKIKSEQILLQIAFSAIIGGAIGNFVDRVFTRYVVDFIDWHFYDKHWPVFNIADVAISIGMGLIILDMILEKIRSKKTTEKK